jgi:Ca-activated chloride channel family protein
MTLRKRVLSVALLAVALGGYALAVQGPPVLKQPRRTVQPNAATAAPQTPQDKSYTIGVNVELVVLHASVYDKSGNFAAGLKKSDFKVFEDGVAQTVTTFSQEDVPVSLGILVDISGSMRTKIGKVTDSALEFIRASNPADQSFLVAFNDRIELVQDYTSDLAEISGALKAIVVYGGTALYDAVVLGVEKAQNGARPKKAIIVISDGEDRDSYYKLDQMLAKVRESDVAVYCVGFLDPVVDRGKLINLLSKNPAEKARGVLTRIAHETGGKAFFPQATAELSGIVAEIAHELRHQYSIAYISSNSVKDGSWRSVKVTLEGPNAQQYHVRTRAGYFAAKRVPS